MIIIIKGELCRNFEVVKTPIKLGFNSFKDDLN